MNIRSFLIIVLVVVAGGCWESPLKDYDNNVSSNSADDNRNAMASNTGDRSNINTNTNANTKTNMSGEKQKTGFTANLPTGFVEPSDPVGNMLLREYGSVFVTRAKAPTKVIFRDESDVSAFQSVLSVKTAQIGGHTLELQSAAMDDLKNAIAEAEKQGLSISPRGADSAKRTYNETVSLWNSRVEPALKHWVGKGKLTQADAERIRKLSTYEQVSEVLKLEENGIYFAKDLSKSIIYSVAPPGTSQHLSLLALDVKEFDNAKIRAILAQHGWFRTVASDLPHFTYIGASESELPSLGLKKTTAGGGTFWVPDIR